MCTNLFSYQNHSKYKFILAANRDEFYGRPTAKADFWKDQPDILAGRDLLQGGTWLGITTHGRFGMLTNYRDIFNIKTDAISRGFLVSEFLESENSPLDYVRKIKNPENYNGFNLIVTDFSSMVYFSNKKDKPAVILPGNYGLSNASLDTPWPKLEKGKKLFEQVIQQDNFSPNDLFDILKDTQKFPYEQLPKTGLQIEMERQASALFVKTENYGTVSSTVLLLDYENNVSFYEKNYFTADPENQIAEFKFKIK